MKFAHFPNYWQCFIYEFCELSPCSTRADELLEYFEYNASVLSYQDTLCLDMIKVF